MRLNNLDYLRGLMAFVIMIYHYFSWTYKPYESDSLIGVFGIYGVSIFYILSGLTLYFVYINKLFFSNIFDFIVKRIFRIYPLLILSIILTIYVLGKEYDTKTIIINVTGLFGFIDPDNYITTGSWSIGNELVFYSLFPIIIILEHKWKYTIESFFALTSIIAIYFAFFIFNDALTLGGQWEYYVNPLNQIFLFSGGMLIGKLFKTKKRNILGITTLVIAISITVFYNVDGDKINLVSGWNRILFSILAFMLTISFLLIDFKLPSFLDKSLSKLGHISYSLYLLHVIVFWLVARYINRINSPELFLSTSIIITVILSLVSYSFFETKFVLLGKKIISKFNK